MKMKIVSVLAFSFFFVSSLTPFTTDNVTMQLVDKIINKTVPTATPPGRDPSPLFAKIFPTIALMCLSHSHKAITIRKVSITRL